MDSLLSTLERAESELRSLFEGHECTELRWGRGGIASLAPWMKVLRFAPGPAHEAWTYATVGAYALNITDGWGLEFVVHAYEPSDSLCELLSMLAYYSHSQRLGVGHTAPIGWPWLPDSPCDHILLSLPYPLGDSFEICHVSQAIHSRRLWVVPVTRDEVTFLHQNGLESLESLFESHGIDYMNPFRASVVVAI